MSNVIVTVATVAQDFPAGTVDTLFTYNLATAAGVAVTSQTSSSATDTFANVVPGDYVVTVTKNGVSASASFTVAATNVSLQVPQTVSVTFA